MKGDIMITKEHIKWHNLMMKCREEGCPTIHVKPCENLSKVLKDVCNITCNAHLPVVTDFQKGFINYFLKPWSIACCNRVSASGIFWSTPIPFL